MTMQVKARAAITVGVGLKDDDLMSIKESLSELNELVETLQIPVVASLTQRLQQWVPSTLIGAGKLDEIKQTIEDSKAQLVVIDHQLTGAQIRNLSEELKVTVVDRTQLIIEIFARRAQSHEGKLQVELAQMLDQYSRMVGAWHGSLSRQGGGIGTVGPGEKAIEMDRRTIRNRIAKIRRDLENVRSHRSQHRSSRRRNNIPSFALIGYSNAGKSTLHRALTHSDVLVADQFFATLDPTTRKVFLPNAPAAVLTDTVGFIRKLPTELVEAFKATLEESAESDVLIHVIDFSSHYWETQMQVVEDLIEEFKWDHKPLIHVFNKSDLVSTDKKFRVKSSPRVFVSALTGQGLDELKREMVQAMAGFTTKAELFFEHKDQHQIFELARDTKILRQEEGSTGTLCVALLTESLMSKWKSFIVSSEHSSHSAPQY